MTFDELREQLHTIAEQCNESRDQQIIKSILLSLRGAMLSYRHEALMRHMSDFAKRELIRLQAMRN